MNIDEKYRVFKKILAKYDNLEIDQQQFRHQTRKAGLTSAEVFEFGERINEEKMDAVGNSIDFVPSDKDLEDLGITFEDEADFED